MKDTKYESVVEMLKWMLAGNIADKDHGICYNLDGILSENDVRADGYLIVCVLSNGWEHHTGQSIFPIPFDRNANLWEGEQLAYRQDLMKYIISKIEASTTTYDELHLTI
jgi:hypothetical protein